MLPVSMDFLRGLLGALCLFFAHFLGRAAVAASRGELRKSRLYTWLLRTLVTLGAVCFRGVDGIAAVVLVLAALSLSAGVWVERHPRKQEDLTKTIFPGE